MQRLPSINPADSATYENGIGTFDIGAANAGSKILLKNFTPLNLDLDFLNGSTDMLHAWEANYWTLDGDQKQIEWQIDVDSLNVAAPPISAVFMTLYGPDEKIQGTYPIFVNVQTSIGNPGGTPTAVTSLQNTGNVSGTNVVSVSSTAAAGNTWVASNDGLWTLAVTIAAALVQVLKTNESDPVLQLGSSGHIVEVLGKLQLDQDVTVEAGANVWLQGIGDSTNFHIAIDLSNHDGTVKFPHTIFLPTGSLTGITTFTASLNNTFSMVNHGLGVVPDNVIGAQNQSTVDATSGNLIYDKAGSTTTQARLCWNAGATARTIICTAYKE